jgi:hypothetical protein
MLDMTDKPTHKRKKKAAGEADRHRSPFMIRLPPIYQEQLRKLRAITRRPMTTEVQIALEKHLAENKLWPPEAAEE